MGPLQALGVTATAERIYLDLIERGKATLAELTERHGVGDTALDAAVAELERAGLLTRSGADLRPQPPQLALEALAQRHIREAALARESAVTLARRWETAVGGDRYLEQLPSPEVARAVLDHVQADARERVRAITVGNLETRDHTIVGGFFEALGRGVSYQVVYGTRVLQDPRALGMVQTCIDAGEQARVFPQVPLNLTIVDDRWALIAARAPVAGNESTAALVVHQSPLLTGLVGVFDTYWRMAVPITSNTEVTAVAGMPTRETKRLLTYLSAGLTDESIAREFGVSERTIARRISRLQEILGAQTRFQLGMQASRQGWL